MDDKCEIKIKINTLKSYAQSKGFSEFEITPTTFLEKPWYRIHYTKDGFSGTFDISRYSLINIDAFNIVKVLIHEDRRL